MSNLIVTYILIGLAITWLILLWLFIVQFIRNKKLENIVNILYFNMDTISQYIQESDKVLSELSLKEAFSNDDEVGVFFNSIQEIQSILNNFVKGNSNEKEE